MAKMVGLLVYKFLEVLKICIENGNLNLTRKREWLVRTELVTMKIL
jgi:hypothetical protein